MDPAPACVTGAAAVIVAVIAAAVADVTGGS